MKIELTPQGHIATDDGEKIFYRVDGAGSPVVVVHGGPGLSMSYLCPDLTPLARTHMLISYDQRGTGRSSLVADDANISFAKHVDDLEALRRHFGFERLSLLGHSWGAAPAAGYAMRFADRVERLVLVCPMAPRNTPYRDEFVRNRRERLTPAERTRFDELAAALPQAADPVGALGDLLALYFRAFFVNPDLASRLRFTDDPPEAIGNASRVEALTMASLGDYDWRADLASVRARTLVIHGDADPIPLESAREWANAIPSAQFILLRQCGHFPQLEQPAEFFAALDRFLG